EPRTPVHVHRRLAVIVTRYAGGGGRPVELYSGAALLDGRAARLAKDKSPLSPQLCRIIEFETPAMILTNWDTRTVPATYISAYFDFKATDQNAIGVGSDAAAGTTEFYLRFVGRREHLKKLMTLYVFLSVPGVAVKDDPENALSFARVFAPSA